MIKLHKHKWKDGRTVEDDDGVIGITEVVCSDPDCSVINFRLWFQGDAADTSITIGGKAMMWLDAALLGLGITTLWLSQKCGEGPKEGEGEEGVNKNGN